MNRARLAAAVGMLLLASTAVAGARDRAPPNDEALAATAPLEVTINPEVRVSVRRTETPLPELVCGQPSRWLVRVVNQGGATSQLNVVLVGVGGTAVEVLPIAPRLEGAPVEYRWLELTVRDPTPIDATLRFDAGPGTQDLGHRAEFPVLLRCGRLEEE